MTERDWRWFFFSKKWFLHILSEKDKLTWSPLIVSIGGIGERAHQNSNMSCLILNLSPIWDCSWHRPGFYLCFILIIIDVLEERGSCRDHYWIPYIFNSTYWRNDYLGNLSRFSPLRIALMGFRRIFSNIYLKLTLVSFKNSHNYQFDIRCFNCSPMKCVHCFQMETIPRQTSQISTWGYCGGTVGTVLVGYETIEGLLSRWIDGLREAYVNQSLSRKKDNLSLFDKYSDEVELTLWTGPCF